MVVAEEKYSYDYDSFLKEDTENNKKSSKKPNKKRKDLFVKASVIFWVALVSTALIIILLRYTAITEAEYKVGRLNKQIEELENNLRDIKVTYDSLTRSDIIEKAALNKLNMQYPQYDQMVFLNIEDTDSTDLVVLEQKNSIDEQKLEEQYGKKRISRFFKASLQKIYSLLD